MIMDPLALIKELRELAEINYQAAWRLADPQLLADYAQEMADKFNALDTWMQRNGFNPWIMERIEYPREITSDHEQITGPSALEPF